MAGSGGKPSHAMRFKGNKRSQVVNYAFNKHLNNGSKQNNIVLYENSSRQLTIKEKELIWRLYSVCVGIVAMIRHFKWYSKQHGCHQGTQIIFPDNIEDNVCNKNMEMTKVDMPKLKDKFIANKSVLEVKTAELKRNTQPNTWLMRSSDRNNHRFTVKILHKAVKMAGPDVVEMYTAYMNGLDHNSHNIARNRSQLVYVVLFPEDCRLFLLIPSTKDSFIFSKELIYLQEYPRLT